MTDISTLNKIARSVIIQNKDKKIKEMLGHTPFDKREEYISLGRSINIKEKVKIGHIDHMLTYILTSAAEDLDLTMIWSTQSILRSITSTVIDLSILMSALENLEKNDGYIPMIFDDIPVNVGNIGINEIWDAGDYVIPPIYIDSKEMLDFEPIIKYQQEFNRQQAYVKEIIENALGFSNGLLLLTQMLKDRYPSVDNLKMKLSTLTETDKSALSFREMLKHDGKIGDAWKKQSDILRFARSINSTYFPEMDLIEIIQNYGRVEYDEVSGKIYRS